jgi:hypothetical protein
VDRQRVHRQELDLGDLGVGAVDAQLLARRRLDIGHLDAFELARRGLDRRRLGPQLVAHARVVGEHLVECRLGLTVQRVFLLNALLSMPWNGGARTPNADDLDDRGDGDGWTCSGRGEESGPSRGRARRERRIEGSPRGPQSSDGRD